MIALKIALPPFLFADRRALSVLSLFSVLPSAGQPLNLGGPVPDLKGFPKTFQVCLSGLPYSSTLGIVHASIKLLAGFVAAPGSPQNHSAATLRAGWNFAGGRPIGG